MNTVELLEKYEEVVKKLESENTDLKNQLSAKNKAIIEMSKLVEQVSAENVCKSNEITRLRDISANFGLLLSSRDFTKVKDGFGIEGYKFPIWIAKNIDEMEQLVFEQWNYEKSREQS